MTAARTPGIPFLHGKMMYSTDNFPGCWPPGNWLTQPCIQTRRNKIFRTIHEKRKQPEVKRFAQARASNRAAGALLCPIPRRGMALPEVQDCGRDGRGKRGYRRTGNPFIKALVVDQTTPDTLKKAGFPPPPGCYLLDS